MAISHKAIKDAIIEYKGNVTKVALSFGVSRGAIINRVNKSDTLKEKLQEARDMRNDSVTDTLYEMAVTDKVPSVAIFIAKTQMGWKETAVTEHSGEVIIQLDWGDVEIDHE